MHQSSRQILFIGMSIGGISILHFLGLVLKLPFVITATITAAALVFAYRWIMEKRPLPEQEPIGTFPVAAIIVCFVFMTNKVYDIAQVHGAWDAWATWNLHAIYLADIQHWKNMLLNTKFDHPDYPLALPGTLAFLSKLTGGFHELVSFSFHFLVALCIPLLVFLEIRRKSILIACLALILFARNEFYIMQGTQQLADTLLAFFFLCALICINHHEEDKRMLVLSAAFLGCCIWTKNEGIILAAIFAGFHFRELFTRYRIKYTAMGISVPLAAWLLFKLAYAPPSDMLHGQSSSTYLLLLDKSRYRLIYDHFINNLQYFRDVQWGLIIYALICVLKRQWPSKQMLMVCACLLVYMAVYVVSHYNLDWHLSTSQSRLMHQLMPAFMYLLALRFSGSSSKPAFQARFFSVRQRLQ